MVGAEMCLLRLVAASVCLMVFGVHADPVPNRSELLAAAERLRIDESEYCVLAMPSLMGGDDAKANPGQRSSLLQWRASVEQCFERSLQDAKKKGMSEFFGPVLTQAKDDKLALISAFAGGEITSPEFRRRVTDLTAVSQQRLDAAREAFRQHLAR